MAASMQRFSLVLLLLAALLLAPLQASAAGVEDPTRLLVTYAAAVDGAAEAAALPGARLVHDPGAPSGVHVLELPGRTAAAAAARTLASRPDVVAVEPDRELVAAGRIDRVLDIDVATEVVAAATTASDPTAPADRAGPVLAPTSSWGVENTGQRVAGRTGRAGVDVGATLVWPRTTGREVVVAVIDSGVDTSHPLLRDRMWVNPGERRDGRDTDGNGFVDDVHGWNFVDGDAQVFKDPAVDFHGTHVAAIIAAAAHAPTGFRSTAPDARIMALRFIDGEAGRASDAIAALRYAQANGAHVVNASWSAEGPSAALRQALSEMTIPVVVAAGNEGERPGAPVQYPAAHGLPNVISVAAVDHTGELAPFSSRDRGVVDVAAPGAAILSAYPGGRMALSSGTSQAAPHVSGLVALALQRHPGTDPVLLAQLVRDGARPFAGAAETRAGGIARAPAVLDRLGTRVPACPSIDRVPFADVTPGGAHHDAVACMLARGVTRGTSATTYGAADGLTRAQIASLVANTLEPTGALPAAPDHGRFSDIDDNLHRDNIERLGALGIVRGADGQRYEPGRIVTRAEFAAVVVRAAEWLAEGEVRAAGAPFDDTAGHPELDGIAKAAGLVIVTGRSPGIFDPDVPLRRDQAASMLTRLLDRLVQQGLLTP